MDIFCELGECVHLLPVDAHVTRGLPCASGAANGVIHSLNKGQEDHVVIVPSSSSQVSRVVSIQRLETV